MIFASFFVFHFQGPHFESVFIESVEAEVHHHSVFTSHIKLEVLLEFLALVAILLPDLKELLEP